MSPLSLSHELAQREGDPDYAAFTSGPTLSARLNEGQIEDRELGMTQRYMHLSPAALDSAIRLLDQPFSVQSFGDILETGRVSEEKING